MTTVTTTAVQQGTPLRKRLRVLERTQSSTLNFRSTGSKAPPSPDTKLTQDDVVGSHFAEYDESPSDLSDDELSPGGVEAHHASPEGRQKPKRPTIDTGDHGRSPMKQSPMSPTSRAWYEFDLAVVVALVSPIGNWLTGTDHVKNILLIVLLIFYLHQIIESKQLHDTPHCLYLTNFFLQFPGHFIKNPDLVTGAIPNLSLPTQRRQNRVTQIWRPPNSKNSNSSSFFLHSFHP